MTSETFETDLRVERLPAPPRMPTGYELADCDVGDLGSEADWRETSTVRPRAS